LRYGHNSDKWGEHIGSPLPSVMSIFVGTDLRVCPIVIIFGYFVIMTKPQLITVLGKNGGYILGPSHAVQAGTPPENIVMMFDTARDFYPFH